MGAALRVEWVKLRRSPVTLTATALMVLLLPVMGLGLHVVAQRGGTTAVALKAEALLVGEGWVGYLGAVDQVAAAAAFVGAGVVVAWVFGREHVDRTFGALFALPASRATIAAAKFVVLTGWSVAFAAVLTATTTAVGLLAGVGAFDAGAHVPELVRLFVVALSTALLALAIAIVASVGRGYLPAVGAIVLVIAAAQMAVLSGTGGWFPFAVPGLLAVAGHPGAPSVHVAQVGLVPLTSALAAWGTVVWWRRAEIA